MREFKFRAWDAKAKHMFMNDYLSKIADHAGGQVSTQWPIQSLLHDETLIFMQYIGLKDEHGKEIYEGDVVKPWNDDRTYQIVWLDEWATFSLKQVAGHDWPADAPLLRFGEVIGSIYENPELLR